MTVNCLLLIKYLKKTERYVTDFFYSFYTIYYSLPIQSQTRIMWNMHTWRRVQDYQTLFLDKCSATASLAAKYAPATEEGYWCRPLASSKSTANPRLPCVSNHTSCISKLHNLSGISIIE